MPVECPLWVESRLTSAAMKAPVAPPPFDGATAHHRTAKIETILTAAEGSNSAVSLTYRSAPQNLPTCQVVQSCCRSFSTGNRARVSRSAGAITFPRCDSGETHSCTISTAEGVSVIDVRHLAREVRHRVSRPRCLRDTPSWLRIEHTRAEHSKEQEEREQRDLQPVAFLGASAAKAGLR